MQKVKLPLTIDPVLAAHKGLEYNGFYTSDQLIRVAEYVDSIDSDVDVFLLFRTDEEHRVFVKGYASVDLTLTCQRCCHTFSYHLKTAYCFTPVTGEAYHQLSEIYRETYDFIEMNESGELDLMSMIEDEMILSIPAFPVHENEDCHLLSTTMVFGSLPEETKESHPFSVLSHLKKK